MALNRSGEVVSVRPPRGPGASGCSGDGVRQDRNQMEEAGDDGTFPRSHFSLPVFTLMVPERTLVASERTLMDLAEVQEPSGWGCLPLESRA